VSNFSKLEYTHLNIVDTDNFLLDTVIDSDQMKLEEIAGRRLSYNAFGIIKIFEKSGNDTIHTGLMFWKTLET